jgi:hypothetical protein
MPGLVPGIHVYLVTRQDVDGRDKPGHDENLEIHILRTAAAGQIGLTSTTSGTKCLSKFWIPCCSVAVEDGQPAQEPFMLR